MPPLLAWRRGGLGHGRRRIPRARTRLDAPGRRFSHRLADSPSRTFAALASRSAHDFASRHALRQESARRHPSLRPLATHWPSAVVRHRASSRRGTRSPFHAPPHHCEQQVFASAPWVRLPRRSRERVPKARLPKLTLRTKSAECLRRSPRATIYSTISFRFSSIASGAPPPLLVCNPSSTAPAFLFSISAAEPVISLSLSRVPEKPASSVPISHIPCWFAPRRNAPLWPRNRTSPW